MATMALEEDFTRIILQVCRLPIVEARVQFQVWPRIYDKQGTIENVVFQSASAFLSQSSFQ
jgi:hypothetical protein